MLKKYGYHYSEVIDDEVWFQLVEKPETHNIFNKPHLEITYQEKTRRNRNIWSYAIRKNHKKYMINGVGCRSEHALTIGIAIAKEIEIEYSVVIPGRK